MSFDVARLLDPSPMAMEMGYRRLDSGILHVAARTDLHRCTGEMFDWWFGSRPETREYRWWHPKDHVSSAWSGGAKGSSIGATHVVEERLTNLPPVKLQLQFRDATETFSEAALQDAKANGAVSAVLVGHVGPGEDAKLDETGRMIGSRVIHICRDTEWGTVLRSAFLLGWDLPDVGVPAQALGELFPDIMAPNLLQHCYDEMTFLSRILPSVYAAEAMSPDQIRRPW